MTTIHTRQLTVMHVRRLKIQRVQKVNMYCRALCHQFKYAWYFFCLSFRQRRHNKNTEVIVEEIVTGDKYHSFVTSVQVCKALVSTSNSRVTAYWLTWLAVSSADYVCTGFMLERLNELIWDGTKASFGHLLSQELSQITTDMWSML